MNSMCVCVKGGGCMNVKTNKPAVFESWAVREADWGLCVGSNLTLAFSLRGFVDMGFLTTMQTLSVGSMCGTVNLQTPAFLISQRSLPLPSVSAE